MPIGDPQNPKITRLADSEYLEELAEKTAPISTRPSEPEPEGPLAASSARMPRSVESDPRPTGEMAKDELLGLLHIASTPAPDPPRSVAADRRPTSRIAKDELLGLLPMTHPTSPTPSPERAPAAPRMANARLVRTRSTSDDFQTQRMQAEHFQALLRDGQALIPITPALLESIDWYEEADVGAQRAMTGPREPEALLDELDRDSWDNDITEIASRPRRSSSEPPQQMATAPQRRPSAPPPARRAAIEMSPLLGASEPRPYDADHPPRHATLPPAPAPSPRLRLLLGLLLLAFIGALIGLAITL